MKSEFPKEMHHPGFAPAVLAPADPIVRPRGQGIQEGEWRASTRVGAPERFPPVTVNNEDQEEYYLSRGYFVGRQQMPIITQHKDRENIRMREIPQADEPPPTGEYPKWVGDKIAKNAAEEAEILRVMKEFEGSLPTVVPPLTTAIDPAELAEFRAWKAMRERAERLMFQRTEEIGKAPKKRPFSSKDRGSKEQRELLVLCLEAGIKADTRYSVKRLREMLGAATAPKEAFVPVPIGLNTPGMDPPLRVPKET